jgi:hypothetical protein
MQTFNKEINVDYISNLNWLVLFAGSIFLWKRVTSCLCSSAVREGVKNILFFSISFIISYFQESLLDIFILKLEFLKLEWLVLKSPIVGIEMLGEQRSLFPIMERRFGDKLV